MIADDAWIEWCRKFDELRDQMLDLHHSRRMWRTVQAMINAHQDLRSSGIVLYWLTQCYSAFQLIAVRKQTDPDKRSISLWQLLDLLARTPNIASREHFIAELKAEPLRARYLHLHAPAFEIFAEPGQPFVSRKIVGADRDRLTADVAKAKAVVNKLVAHHQDVAKFTDALPTITWGELDIAIDTIGELYTKYYSLRYPGQTLSNLEPDLPIGWDRIFETAWKPPD